MCVLFTECVSRGVQVGARCHVQGAVTWSPVVEHSSRGCPSQHIPLPYCSLSVSRSVLALRFLFTNKIFPLLKLKFSCVGFGHVVYLGSLLRVEFSSKCLIVHFHEWLLLFSGILHSLLPQLVKIY